MSSRSIIKLLIALVILLAAFFAYKYFFVPSNPEANTPGLQAVTSSDLSGNAPAVDDEFIKLLDRLKGVELNSDLFSTAVWNSLENFRVELVDEPKHRRNPFALVGFGAVDASSTATSTLR